MHGLGRPDRPLSVEEVEGAVREALAGEPLDGERVLAVIPDGTRTAPIPWMFRLLCEELSGRVARLEFLVALGTHQPMSEEQLSRLVGVSPGESEEGFRDVTVSNHEWWDPGSLVSLGSIPAGEVAEISGGLLREEVEVRVNRRVTECDRVLVCGPVFPHEVAGFSGGNKYFFPGVSGPEIIALSHWLGALITNREIIGTLGTTPVRRLFDRAAELITTPKLCLALVTTRDGGGLAGLYASAPEKAWAAAAELSARIHIEYVERPYHKVLSVMPESYDDIWTAAKGMYKIEPAVADGGEVVIYAPHITEFSYTHGNLLAEVGYHVRDYFTEQWERFRDYPWTVLAHSTHLKGTGTYERHTGEKPRVNVTLATGISRERCLQHNVGYRDPDEIDPEDWAGREDEGILLIPKAGEVLYRLSNQR